MKRMPLVIIVFVMAFFFVEFSAGVFPVQAQTPCLVNFTSPLVVPVSGQLTDVFIDDSCEHVYLTNSSSNEVEVFSLQTFSLGLPIAVGSLPAGLDASPDGSTLYVANSGGNNISVVDLTKGVETNKIIVAPAQFSNDTPFSIAVAQSGLVFFSTTFAGSGFGARMLQLDPVSEIVTQRKDFWLGGTTTEATFLKASGDRSAIGIMAGDISSAPVFKYTSLTNTFTTEKDLEGFISSIAVDESGNTFLVNPGTYVLDSNLNRSGTIPPDNTAGIPPGSFGVAVDPSGKTGYRVNQSGIEVLDLSRFLVKGSLPQDITSSSPSARGVGLVAISRDGSILAVITDTGFSVVAPVTLTVNKTGVGSGTVVSSDGKINCGSACSYIYGSGSAITLSAPGAASATGCGGTLSGSTYTIGAITANCTVTATFAANVINGACGLANGQTLIATPTVNLCSVGTMSTLSGTGPWLWTCSGTNGGATASCMANIKTWTVTPTAGIGGSISPWAPLTVNSSGNASFTITPNTGYRVLSVTGCGGALNGSTYTTGGITGNCLVTAGFGVAMGDVSTQYWAYNYIDAIYEAGITVGCGTYNGVLDYCPADNVTRGQMAAFIIRAIYGENFSYTSTPYFIDVPATNVFFKYVQMMKDKGLTTVSGTYNVNENITRGEMAAFIIRAIYGENFSYTSTPYFTDVAATNVFFKYVQMMKDNGLTTASGTYNVDENVTRDQMAAFIARAFLGMS
jgi:YVTN family beta-propeller protein